jgi:hypothetical protein
VESVLSLSYYGKHDIAHVSVPESSEKQGCPRFPCEDENELVRGNHKRKRAAARLVTPTIINMKHLQ